MHPGQPAVHPPSPCCYAKLLPSVITRTQTGIITPPEGLQRGLVLREMQRHTGSGVTATDSCTAEEEEEEEAERR